MAQTIFCYKAAPYCSRARLEKPGIWSSCTAALVAGSAAAMHCSTLRDSGRRDFWLSSSIAVFSCDQAMTGSAGAPGNSVDGVTST